MRVVGNSITVNKIVLVISNICLLLPSLLAPISLSNKNNCSYKCFGDKRRSSWRVLGELVARRRSTVTWRAAVIRPSTVHQGIMHSCLFTARLPVGPHALPQADWPVMSLRTQGWRWRKAEKHTCWNIHYYRSWTQEGGKPPRWRGMRCQRECELLMLFTFSGTCVCVYTQKNTHTHVSRCGVWHTVWWQCCLGYKTVLKLAAILYWYPKALQKMFFTVSFFFSFFLSSVI